VFVFLAPKQKLNVHREAGREEMRPGRKVLSGATANRRRRCIMARSSFHQIGEEIVSGSVVKMKRK
jgi:hypothetical protein